MALSFTSFEFLAFLAICLISIGMTRSVSRKKWLLIIFSCIFCLSFGVAAVLLVTVISLVDFNVGHRLASSTSSKIRARWLWISLAVNLGALVSFKYFVFFAEIVAGPFRSLGVHISLPTHLLLPIGLSYFTFAGMSYVLDIYYEKTEPAQNLSEYVCYLTYFPKFVAGPIVRAADLLPQFRSGIRVTAQDFETGCAYLLSGAVKKLVIADQLASHVSMILAAPQHYDALTLLQGMIGYTVQIYCDFSGYSDMAIGCARLMGIRFPQNFRMPYSAVNIAEFWRRWHVTLSTWFRDYVFLPLELRSRGRGSAIVRASRNIVVTMVLCGLWHGASWNFVLWGGLHGVALAMYHLYVSVLPQGKHEGVRLPFGLGKLLARVLTLSVVMAGWVLFGTQTLTFAFQYLWRLVTWSRDGVALGSPYILPLAALVLLFHVFVDKDRNLVEELTTHSVPVRVLAYGVMLLILTSLVPMEAVPFVYVQF